jgi:hypothetical protein
VHLAKALGVWGVIGRLSRRDPRGSLLSVDAGGLWQGVSKTERAH